MQFRGIREASRGRHICIESITDAVSQSGKGGVGWRGCSSKERSTCEGYRRRGHGKVILDPGRGEVLKKRRLRRKLDAKVK